MSPRTTSYLHTSSFLYQCLHQIACFMCVFHISKASPNKKHEKLTTQQPPPPKPAPAATSSKPANIRLLRLRLDPLGPSAMLVRIAIGLGVGALFFLICWWVPCPWRNGQVSVMWEPFDKPMGRYWLPKMKRRPFLERHCLSIGREWSLFDVMKCN